MVVVAGAPGRRGLECVCVISPKWLTAVALSAALVLFAALSAAGGVHDDDPHLLVVPDTPRAASVLGGSSARVIARYESFKLVEATGDEMVRLVRAGKTS